MLDGNTPTTGPRESTASFATRLARAAGSIRDVVMGERNPPATEPATVAAAAPVANAAPEPIAEPTADPRLLESEQRYAAVIENASDMIQSVRPDGSFEFVNKAWKDTMGYDEADLEKMSVFEIIHPGFIEHCQADFMRAISGETVEYLETRFLTKDGRTVPVEGSVTSRFLGDEVVATHGFFRDISERLRARELEERTAQLEREEQARYLEKMAALGKLSAGLAHELNNPAAAVQRANSGLQETIKRRDAAMREFSSAGCDASGWQAMEEILGHVRVVRADERQADPIALSEAEGEIESWLEDHDIERAWELAPSLAESKIAATDLKAFAATVPPPALPAGIRWLAETLDLGESTDIIAQSSRRISELVQAIKGYSHMDRATEHEADIHDGLENTLVILAHRLQNVDVQRQYDRALPAIRVYGNTLNQVWTNILDNAIDAMDGAGKIAIRTRRDGDHLVVEIEDQGKGIPPEDLTRIFEPFFTSKPQGQGTGLGLDTAWRIVTSEHAGSITAESEPGRTVFRVMLPITLPAESEGAAA